MKCEMCDKPCRFWQTAIKVGMDKMHQDGLTSKSLRFHKKCMEGGAPSGSCLGIYVEEYCSKRFQFDHLNIEIP